jgi:hypothetical protein
MNALSGCTQRLQVKRDLVIVKRDLVSVKRDLVSVKDDSAAVLGSMISISYEEEDTCIPGLCSQPTDLSLSGWCGCCMSVVGVISSLFLAHAGGFAAAH